MPGSRSYSTLEKNPSLADRDDHPNEDQRVCDVVSLVALESRSPDTELDAAMPALTSSEFCGESWFAQPTNAAVTMTIGIKKRIGFE